MPQILLQEDDHRHGYHSFAHLESIMHYPEEGADREVFRRAVYRELLLPELEDDLNELGSVELGRDRFKAIAYGDKLASLTSGASFQLRRRKGFLAASCLRFMMSAAVHHPTAESPRDLRQIQKWQQYLEKYLYKRSRQGSSPFLKEILKAAPLTDYTSLREARRDYLGVAHLWAAAFDIDGMPTQVDQHGSLMRCGEDGNWERREEEGRWTRVEKESFSRTDLFCSKMLIPFLSRAEAIRRAAQNLDVYRFVHQRFEERQLFKIATTVDVLPDPENGIPGGTETVLVLPVQTYAPDPLPEDALAIFG